MILDQDIKYLKGVGPARAKTLAEELEIRTPGDLLRHYPYKYIDRTTFYSIRQLQEDMSYVQLRGQIIDFETEGEGRRRRLKATFTDGTGYLELVWFNGIKYVEKTYKLHTTYIILGKPTLFGRKFSIAHPEIEEAKGEQTPSQPMQPHYHTTEKMKRSGFTSKLLGELVKGVFEMLGAQGVPETLPEHFTKHHRLISLDAALHAIHFPHSAEALPAAHRRLKFEELFFLQLDILRYAHNRRMKHAGFPFAKVGECFHDFFHHHLPFSLTEAQKRVIREIRHDMGSGRQMNRLLQGDVGSGKTMVALMCCLIAIDNRFQACLMAPTEILAEQHYATVRSLLGDMNLRIALLTGSTTTAERTKTLRAIESGEIHLLIGTHALIEPTVRFHNLGLAIIDEQHRFGVKQRAKLWNKNTRPPHILVMTATPIPRTLAMTLYGDLDVSVIDELPPGRKPIKTIHYYHRDQPRLIDGLRDQLAQGRQAYIVYPLIEESEKSDLQDLEAGYEQFQKLLPEYAIGKVHGKMRPAEKESAMQAFNEGPTRILVSTTVIEVGVNVPNATVMVVMEAHRFGLAQLHQLRGRVGRGAERSYCVLVTKMELSQTSRRRIAIMTESTDGFEIAEEDLKLRGPGDLEGTQQSGLPFQLHIANITRDADLMAEARQAAADVVASDPDDTHPAYAAIRQQMSKIKKERTNFSAIS